jgi:hypothetical protein
MRIRDGKNSDPGWKKVGSGIRIIIPDPQHCVPICNLLHKGKFPEPALSIRLIPNRIQDTKSTTLFSCLKKRLRSQGTNHMRIERQLFGLWSEIYNFLSQIIVNSSGNMIRDVYNPGSRIVFSIPDPGVKKHRILDPGSATPCGSTYAGTKTSS